MRRSLCIYFVCLTPLLCQSLEAATYQGQLQTRALFDNRYIESRNYLEQSLALGMRQDKFTLDSDMALVGSQSGEIAWRCYELALSAQVARQTEFSLGRFSHSDSLGYYALDGLQLRTKWRLHSASAYVGSLLRLEEYSDHDAGRVTGFRYRYKNVSESQILPVVYDLALDWQKPLSSMAESRTGVGIRIAERQERYYLRSTSVYSGGTAHLEASRNEFMFKATKRTHVGFRHAYFQPTDESLSFKQRFYEVYSQQKQTTWRADFTVFAGERRSSKVSARLVQREGETKGRAVSWQLQESFRTIDRALIQLDGLELGSQSYFTVYANAEHALTPFSRLSLAAAGQRQNRALAGENRALALEIKSRTFVNAKTQMSFSLSHISNSAMQNETMLEVGLVYEFSGTRGKGR